MCTGRVDLSFPIRAFLNGADGVITGGCWPGECHYVTEGNYDALGNTYLCKSLLELVGVNPERLRIEWIAASEGSRFAEVMSDFVEKTRALGPLSRDEGLNGSDAKLKLHALNRMVPYLKLVEREKLRVPTRTEEAYKTFYESAEVDRLLRDLIADKLTMSRILVLLEASPLATGEIAERLGLSPSDVSRQLNSASRQGLVGYDLDRKCYTLARPG